MPIQEQIKRIPLLHQIIFIIIINIFFSYSIVFKNYYLLLIIVSIFLLLVILKSNIIPISIILFIIPFTNWAVESNLVPPQIMWIPEVLISLLFLKTLIIRAVDKKKFDLFGIKIIIPFFLIMISSFIYNGANILSVSIFIRALFKYYLLFLIILNIDLDEKLMKIIIKILAFIFGLQLPLAVAKLFIYGQGETPLGLNAHALSTIFPLVAIVFLFSYYFLYKRKQIYLLASLGFIGFSIIGEKRAFALFLPIVLLFLIWHLRENFKIAFKFLILGTIIVGISLYFSSKFITTLNPEREIGGKFDLKYMVDYLLNYTTQTTESGKPAGRASATIAVFNILKERGVPGIVFGFGPGIIMKSRFESADKREMLKTKFGIAYGSTGLNWLSLQVGYIGTLIYFLLFYFFLRKSSKYFRKETDPFWKSLGFGMVGFSFIMLLISFIYIPVFASDAIAAFYFCLMGMIIYRDQNFANNL